MKWVIVVLAIIGIGLNGCLKTSDVKPADVYTYVTIMHMAPASPAAEVYINSSRETNPMPVGSYFSAYSGINPGQMSVTFKKASSDSVIAAVPTSNFDSLKFYTLILYNDPVNAGKAKAAKIYDDYSTMTTDKAAYRFFNMSPDAGDVDFFIDNQKLSAGRKNADMIDNNYFSLFQSYATGSYTLKAKLSGTDSVLAQTTINMTAANAYTVFLKGVSNGTGDNGLKLVALKAANY